MVRLQVRGEGPARAHVNSLLDRQKVFDAKKGRREGKGRLRWLGMSSSKSEADETVRGLYKERGGKEAKGLFSLGGDTMKYTHQRAALRDTLYMRGGGTMERGGGFGGADQVSGPASKMYFRRREEGEAGDGHTRKRGAGVLGGNPRAWEEACVCVSERGGINWRFV